MTHENEQGRWQRANATAAVCPYCEHRDLVNRMVAVGDSSFFACSECNRLWMATLVGYAYSGGIGHGKAIPMVQNRAITVVDGLLTVVDPVFEDEDE